MPCLSACDAAGVPTRVSALWRGSYSIARRQPDRRTKSVHARTRTNEIINVSERSTEEECDSSLCSCHSFLPRHSLPIPFPPFSLSFSELVWGVLHFCNTLVLQKCCTHTHTLSFFPSLAAATAVTEVSSCAPFSNFPASLGKLFLFLFFRRSFSKPSNVVSQSHSPLPLLYLTLSPLLLPASRRRPCCWSCRAYRKHQRSSLPSCAASVQNRGVTFRRDGVVVILRLGTS